MKRFAGGLIVAFMAVIFIALAVILLTHSKSPIRKSETFEKLRQDFMANAFSAFQKTVQHAKFVEKSEKEMTAEELKTKRSLEQELLANAPTHKLILKSNKVMTGYLIEEKPGYVVFSESYRDTGRVSMNVSRSRIKEITTLTNTTPVITYRDVLFKMEFLQMNLYKRKPYTIMTDENYFSVENTVNVLRKLYGQMSSRFSTLIDREKNRENIQILFFSNESAFLSYRNEFAPELEGSVGFYSANLDRLVVFNQKTGALMREGMAHVNAEVDRNKPLAVTPETRTQLKRWQKGQEQRLMYLAKEETIVTVRHEGAHQISYNLGILSFFQPGHVWVTEGIATYCETSTLGNVNRLRSKQLKKAFKEKNIMPLKKLMGLKHLNNSSTYNQSWGLTYFLMHSTCRKGFFNFLRFLRDPVNISEVKREPPLELLCRFLKVEPEEFEKRWLEYLEE
ncbi:DUF1570 domain-containing protein [Verrucomicrobiota bacterium]